MPCIRCEKKTYRRDLCVVHYREQLDQERNRPECSVEDCHDPIAARGWCNRHYWRWRRHGDPLVMAKAERGHGEWRIASDGYVYANRPDHPNAAKDGRISQHVFVMSNYLGRALDSGETVHHKNGIRSDNRVENLELWVSKHPAGQRVADLLSFAHEIIEKYDRHADVA